MAKEDGIYQAVKESIQGDSRKLEALVNACRDDYELETLMKKVKEIMKNGVEL